MHFSNTSTDFTIFAEGIRRSEEYRPPNSKKYPPKRDHEAEIKRDKSNQLSPFPLSPIDLIEHDVDDETFDVHKGAPGAASDVRELLAFDLLGRPIQRWHQQDGGVEVEALRQGRRRDDDF